MADISVYSSPGVYIEEVVQPSAISLANVPFEAAIVAKGTRTKRATSEAIVRGEILAEALTVAGSTPFIATLAELANRKQQNSTLYADGVDVGDANWHFTTASIVGTVAGPYAVVASTNDRLALSLDNKPFVDITLTAGGAQTATQVAADINGALVAHASYGAAYAAAAVDDGAGNLQITSQVVSSAGNNDYRSDIRLITPLVDDATATVLGGGFVGNYQVSSIIQIKDQVYSSAVAYTLDYVSTDADTDDLANANAQSIIQVGSFAGVATFADPDDYQLTGNTVDWNQDLPAQLDGIAGPYDTSVNSNLNLSVNGLAPITVALTSGVGTTAATLAADINLALNTSTIYGPMYSAVATDNAGALRLTAPAQFKDLPSSQGENSSITLDTAALNAVTLIFGIATASLPYTELGTGARPAFASTYFATYEYTRPTSDYNTPWKVSTTEQLIAFTSPLTISNYLVNDMAVAGNIMFENDATSLWLIQIDDSNVAGQPTENEVKEAIDAAKKKRNITEVVLIDTRLSTAAYLKRHIEDESSLMVKHYRRGWYGMARDTAVGDKDTSGSFVFRAQRTLNYAATSPGRGRAIMSAPCNVAKTITLEDGSEVKRDLDSTYVTAASAARHTSFLSPSTSLLRKELIGFDLDDFQTYLDQERNTLASNGVNVVSLDAGILKLTDPVTTEQGAGGVISFVEISAGAQKDNVTREVDRVLDQNLIGIVPNDIADFIFDIKVYIGLTLTALIEAGAIGRYRNPDTNIPRDIDLQRDVQVFQSATDPRTFTFRYFYYLRYPAKRMFGQYSVDNPFWSAQNNAPTS